MNDPKEAPDLTESLKSFAQWVAERPDESTELHIAVLESISALNLIKAGWDPATVQVSANSWARLIVFGLIGKLKEMHDPARQNALARRAALLAAGGGSPHLVAWYVVSLGAITAISVSFMTN